MNPYQRHASAPRQSLPLSQLPDASLAQIGAQLRAVYPEMLDTPAPEDFVLLLGRLEAFSRGRAVATAPSRPY